LQTLVNRATFVAVVEYAPTLRPPPRRQPLSREFIAQHQRARIISALAEEAVEKGYRAVTIADIVRRAGIGRGAFYESFSSKEDCFLAAAEFAVREALQRVVNAAGRAESWPAQVTAGLGAFLEYVSSEPALARTCFVEALSAGPAAIERYERSIQAFVPLFRIGRAHAPNGAALPETLEETIVGGIFWIVCQRIITGQTERIGELLPELVEFSLTPYLGAKMAKRTGA
jgi:AcrR family transcriptional regulator